MASIELVVTAAWSPTIHREAGAGAWKVGVNEANEMERGSEFSRELS
jgi:hypothetical protein